jgi:uncharacterized membrane protein
MNAFLSLGRWLFALPFAIFGLFHFLNNEAMANMVPNYLPAKEIWVYLSGVLLIAASVCMVIGKYDKLATVLLVFFLLAMVGMMHLPSAMANNPSSLAMLLKDLSLAGAAMMYAQNYARDRSVIG